VEPVTKRVNVTFRDGLPLGTRGSFKYDGRSWIAVPLDKYQRITTVTDRLIGTLNIIRTQLTHWVTSHPEDAERVVMILMTIAQAEEIARQAAVDKTEARTS
jgi:predicted type IV restriction endonuclease